MLLVGHAARCKVSNLSINPAGLDFMLGTKIEMQFENWGQGI